MEVVGFVLRVIPESLVVVSLAAEVLLKLVVSEVSVAAVACNLEEAGLVVFH